MTEELIRRFLPRFVDIARERLGRAREADRVGAVAMELHALAGEAAMLGLTEIAERAREAEKSARGAGATVAECAASLSTLDAAVAALAHQIISSHSAAT